MKTESDCDAYTATVCCAKTVNKRQKRMWSVEEVFMVDMKTSKRLDVRVAWSLKTT